MGYLDSILHSIWLLVYRGCRIIPNSLGLANDSGNRVELWNDVLPGEPTLAV